MSGTSRDKKSRGVAFRRADPGDVITVVALVESAYRGESSRSGWTTEADLLDGQRTDAEAVAARIAEPTSVVLLAEMSTRIDGKGGPFARPEMGRLLVACCELERRRESRAYFGMFAVAPTEQGKGLGASVLAEAERTAAHEWGASMLEMTVIAQRGDLLAWYERHGYRRTSETRPFPYGDERLGVPMRPDLYFVVLEKPLGEAQRSR